MQHVTVTCKECGRQFTYARAAVTVSLENAESTPLRCDQCRQHRGRHRQQLSTAFAGPFAQTRRSVWTDQETGFYHHKTKKHYREVASDTAGMIFRITQKDLTRLYELLAGNSVVVLVSGTGSGKSTLVPAKLLDPPHGPHRAFLERLSRQGSIAITQPRIPAVYKVASAIGNIVGSSVGPGSLLGFRHGSRQGAGLKSGEQWNRYNRMVIVTDGSLRNWIQSGEIRKYSLIVIDEAHERNKNIDVIFGLLKRALKAHPRLKVMVVSATINEQLFVDTFADLNIKAACLKITGAKQVGYFGPHFWQQIEALPGCDCWLCRLSATEREKFWEDFTPRVQTRSVPRNVANLVAAIAKRTNEGGILAFLPGQYEIAKTEKLLLADPDMVIPIISIYSALGNDEVERRLERVSKTRAVVLATNIAETSLTIPGLRVVVDSGMVKENTFDFTSHQEKLVTLMHSQDGCKQRWGRVGRTEIGYVYTLYTGHQWQDKQTFLAHSTPAIKRENLDDVIVTMAGAGMDNLEMFPWVDAPCMF